MEYISAEEFLKQPKEVQEAFLNWWKPSIGDLFDDIIDNGVIRIVSYYDKKSKHIIPFSREFKSYIEDCIPLLTEGQLRKFIEDKMECKIDITYNFGYGYDLELTKIDESEGNNFIEESFENLGENLLQAYWKVACEIAKED